MLLSILRAPGSKRFLPNLSKPCPATYDTDSNLYSNGTAQVSRKQSASNVASELRESCFMHFQSFQGFVMRSAPQKLL
jgi:hypothetical protein